MKFCYIEIASSVNRPRERLAGVCVQAMLCGVTGGQEKQRKGVEQRYLPLCKLGGVGLIQIPPAPLLC